MGVASYEIVGSAGEWRVRHDGKAENVYETKEAAFEAAVAAASLALRQRTPTCDSSRRAERPQLAQQMRDSDKQRARQR